MPDADRRALLERADSVRTGTSIEHKALRSQAGAGRRRILLIQTQAENAGAQEISRLVGAGLSARGFEINNLFFFRKSESFDEPPNTVFCASSRPGNPFAFLKFLWALARYIRETQPDA